MDHALEREFDNYDRGRLTRRQLVHAVLAFAIPSAAAGQQPAPLLRGLTVDHVQLTVSDITRSREFYQRLFGSTTRGRVLSDQGNHMVLPGGFISLDPTSAPKGLITHFAVSIDNYSQERTLAAVKQAFPDAGARPIDDGSVFVRDPDGISVQIVAKE